MADRENPRIARKSAVLRYRLCGTPVDILQIEDMIGLLDDTVRGNKKIVLANLNLHGWYYALRHKVMADFLNSSNVAVHIDGMPIAWATSLFGAPDARRARNTHIDLIPHLLRHCEKFGWSVVFVGGAPEHCTANSEAIKRIAPELNFRAFHGFFDINDGSEGSQQSTLLRNISEFRPALLLVGMGMPRQEIWISHNRAAINANLIMPVGGFLDYFAGRTATPPRILGKLGLEGLYRLFKDPRRLAFRYLIEPIGLLWLLLLGTLRGNPWGLDTKSVVAFKEP